MIHLHRPQRKHRTRNIPRKPIRRHSTRAVRCHVHIDYIKYTAYKYADVAPCEEDEADDGDNPMHGLLRGPCKPEQTDRQAEAS
jgi:hypothetical protein